MWYQMEVGPKSLFSLKWNSVLAFLGVRLIETCWACTEKTRSGNVSVVLTNERYISFRSANKQKRYEYRYL